MWNIRETKAQDVRLALSSLSFYSNSLSPHRHPVKRGSWSRLSTVPSLRPWTCHQPSREGVHPIERVRGGTLVTCGGAQDGASTGVSLLPPPTPVTGGKETARVSGHHRSCAKQIPRLFSNVWLSDLSHVGPWAFFDRFFHVRGLKMPLDVTSHSLHPPYSLIIAFLNNSR